MPVFDHIQELRQRLIYSVIAFIVGSIVAYLVYARLFRLLLLPLHSGAVISRIRIDNIYVSGVVTAFLLRMKMSIFFGFVFALPIILWQFWRFVSPGLHKNERKIGLWFVFGSMGLFILGALCAYFILPPSLGFLLGFANVGSGLKPLIHVDQYFSFVTFMVLAFGISFEFPLVLLFLAGINVLSSARLASWRRQAIFLCVFLGAVATPSQDPYSLFALAIPLYIFYEGSILIIRHFMRK
ncbi:MAG: twin-arginine translocase subunit TatC [Actinomycetota bacterium]